MIIFSILKIQNFNKNNNIIKSNVFIIFNQLILLNFFIFKCMKTIKKINLFSFSLCFIYFSLLLTNFHYIIYKYDKYIIMRFFI